MPPLVIAPAAEHDIESILIWTHEHFGEQARLRYEALLVQAIVNVAGRLRHGPTISFTVAPT
jgi:toxin ParE1/3/4